MGCASSKGLQTEASSEQSHAGSLLKAISVPSLHQSLPNDFHIVALTSSTYGILKVDTPKSAEDCRDEASPGAAAAAATGSVEDVLKKLTNLEGKVDAGPQSWLEVSSMLENLKPELEKPKCGGKSQKLDSIDVYDMMLDLDEETGLVRPKARKLAELKKAGKSLPIRTLEELDKRIGGKPIDPTKIGTTCPATAIAEARALLKPVRPVGTTKANVSSVGTTSTEEWKPAAATRDVQDAEIGRNRELIDDEFLQSCRNTMNSITEDEWKVMEALCNRDEGTNLHPNLADEQFISFHKSADTEQKKEHTAKISFESEDIFSLVEEEEKSSSWARGSSATGSSLNDLPGSPLSASSEEDMSAKNPLEDYEELCPPGGKDGVVLYMTSLRSTRKPYENCAKAMEIVKSCGVLLDERDVSMHLEYRNELRDLMQRVVTVPRLFVKGRYIGGMEVITKLAEDGLLVGLFEGIVRVHGGAVCDGCAGAEYVTCLDCNGSCKVVIDKKQVVRCPECNENGLMLCPICS